MMTSTTSVDPSSTGTDLHLEQRDLHQAQAQTLRLLLPQLTGEEWHITLRVETPGSWLYCRPSKASVRLVARVHAAMGADINRVRLVSNRRTLAIPGDRAGDVIRMLRGLTEV